MKKKKEEEEGGGRDDATTLRGGRKLWNRGKGRKEPNNLSCYYILPRVRYSTVRGYGKARQAQHCTEQATTWPTSFLFFWPADNTFLHSSFHFSYTILDDIVCSFVYKASFQVLRLVLPPLQANVRRELYSSCRKIMTKKKK